MAVDRLPTIGSPRFDCSAPPAIRRLACPDDSPRRSGSPRPTCQCRCGGVVGARSVPPPLEATLVDRLLHALEHEQVEAVTAQVIDALTYSLDPRVPAALLRRDSVQPRRYERASRRVGGVICPSRAVC